MVWCWSRRGCPECMVEMSALSGCDWGNVGKRLPWLCSEVWICKCGEGESIPRSGSIPSVELSNERCLR